MARLFDLLWFLAPVIMLAKGIFQDLWKLGLNWDSAVPPDIRRVFKIWLSELPLVSSLRIQRSFSGGAWTEVKSLSLHGFGDASVKGYGACVYLVTHLSNRVVSKLVMSKARVSPIKTVTLPRLELLGALLNL